ncbi:hypothetical protein Goari_012045 [Gossypium aridum]|uniref:DUF4283 domain-containing protein n=1 Tax=Gossypium aridum TaxID=34290 RepID=A0A7J8WZQ7_GOSAI|nr:hypothetical protein [Gossypium aridum]
MVSSLEIAQATESWSTDDRETKKAGFKERDGEADVEMVVDLDSQPKVSWKQMLLEKGVSNQEEGSRSSKVECTEGFEFLEGDVIKDFIQQILIEDMEAIVVLKLLGRNSGALYNQISSLWFPSKLFHLVHIENGYFLAKLQCVEDYTTALLQGP